MFGAFKCVSRTGGSDLCLVNLDLINFIYWDAKEKAVVLVNDGDEVTYQTEEFGSLEEFIAHYPAIMVSQSIRTN